MSNLGSRILPGLRARRDVVADWVDGWRRPPTVAAGIEGLTRNWDIPDAPDEPLFILACGWRSGSTLLQRLTIAGGGPFIWGEPYQRSSLVPILAESLRPFVDYPLPRHVLDEGAADSTTLGGGWIANLYPHPAHLIEAHRDLFRRLYRDPARAQGYEGWGFKEVRLGLDEARYLRLLFPRSRIVFLHRNPYDAWNSYRRNHRGSFLRWPGKRVWSAGQYGTVWRTLTADALEAEGAVGAIVVRYDELITAEGQRRLGDQLGHALVDPAAGERVGSTSWDHRRSSAAELAIVRHRVDPLAARLGYHPPR